MCVCELRMKAVIIGAYHPERGRRRGARAGLGGRLTGAAVEWGGGGGRGVVMSHPDSYGQSLTQPENIFHTLNTVHPIKLSINYFNPQIKDSTKCLMFICSVHLFMFSGTCRGERVSVRRVCFALSPSNCQSSGTRVNFNSKQDIGPADLCKFKQTYPRVFNQW